jgi:hypothetical protein
LSAYSFGQPIDLVPAGTDAPYTATVERAEVWNQELEKACGFPDVWANLSDQDRPFVIQEYWFRGKDPYQIWQFSGCWFTAKNQTGAWEASGDGIVKVSGEVMYVRHFRVF